MHSVMIRFVDGFNVVCGNEAANDDMENGFANSFVELHCYCSFVLLSK